MRLRTTAATLLAALALVLPTAGQSLANDHDDRDSLGELSYRFSDDGDTRHGRIEPADNDTCYQLTHASGNHPAFEVRNDTESLALLFEDRHCGGQAVEALEPGERARDLEVRSVFVKPSDDNHHGRHDGDRRDDWSDDEDRSRGGRVAQAPDFVDSVFRSIG
ncbi:hypothetical protein J7F03_31965 [Streptomyces sp. ISL-43]|uniref:hypothetical protein n=1 Tax=Streptomyces sp. ISL-43 TaxID=2819183 RepID=UPI001BE9AAA1|nr:hypothetical protein [Streptomyces sp. ISL-43]MBT2451595.1 hypothetical protein [Streptomyces sp. ISL-43]